MNKTEAIAAAKVLVGAVASLVSEAAWSASADRSVTFDSSGRVPGQEGYVDTYDEAWLAADALVLLSLQNAAQDQTKRLVVNGDTIEVTPGDLRVLAAGLRERSVLYQLVKERGLSLTEIRVPTGLPEFVPTSSKA